MGAGQWHSTGDASRKAAHSRRSFTAASPGRDRTDKAATRTRRGGLFQIRESRTRHSVSRRRQVFLRKNMTDDSAKPIKRADFDRPQPISTRLRQTRANMLGTDDEQHYWDCQEAANKIDRLRSIVGLQDAAIRSGDTLALTDAEREAIQEAVKAFDEFAGDECRVTALRGLLERTAKLDTNGPRNGAVDTP